MKCHVTLSLDVALVEELKRRGLNLSREVNAYLEEIVKGGRVAVNEQLELVRGEKDLAEKRYQQLKDQQEAREQEARLNERIQVYREYYKKRSVTEPEQTKRWLKDAAKGLGMSAEDLKQRLEAG